MELKGTINRLESSIENPSNGLPEDIFLLISRLTPLINVDLLIKNEQNHTLLTWRDDGYYPPGWHVPGGIIRFKETIADRVRAVGKNELGAEVSYDPTPMAMNEVIHGERKIRGHFISFLYQCRLESQPDESLKCKSNSSNPNEWMWHRTCPDNLISAHEMYRKFI